MWINPTGSISNRSSVSLIQTALLLCVVAAAASLSYMMA